MPPPFGLFFTHPVGSPLSQPFGNAHWANIDNESANVDQTGDGQAGSRPREGPDAGPNHANNDTVAPHRSTFGQVVERIQSEEERLGQIMLGIGTYGSHWLHPAVWQKEHFNEESVGSDDVEPVDDEDNRARAQTAGTDDQDAMTETMQQTEEEEEEAPNPYAMDGSE